MRTSRIHSLFTPHQLTQEKQWMEARDTLVGFKDNGVKQDVKRGLELAAACQHAHAQWLTGVMVGKIVNTKVEAKDVFLDVKESSPASLCFAALLSDPLNEALLRQSANLGYAFAQGVMARFSEENERFKYALEAARQREREGFFLLGLCFEIGDGCEENEDKARENYLLAASLGHVSAMRDLNELLEESSPLRWFWLGEAARGGLPGIFLTEFSSEVEEFKFGSGNAAIVFQIGRALKGRIDCEKEEIFEEGEEYQEWVDPANEAVSFHNAQVTACRRAVDTWSLVGIHFNFVKDIRVLIGKLIWETRDLALFEILEEPLIEQPKQPSARALRAQKRSRQ
jgi:hypothetical protein